MENSDSTQSNSITNLKFSAIRLDVRHLKSSGRHGLRSQVLVISDRTSGFEVKRMVAEKNGIDDHLVSQMDLIATVSSGDAKSEFLVPDDRCLLDAYRVSLDHAAVSFSLKWRKERKPSKTAYTSPSYAQSNSVNAATVQGPCPELALEKSYWKPNGKIKYTNGSNFPGYNKRENGPNVDLSAIDSPIRRKLHATSSSSSSYHSDRSKNECIIHYEPQELPPKTDVRGSNFHSVAVQELRSSTSSTSSDGSLTNPRAIQTGVVGSPGVNSIKRSSNEPQNYSNSFNQLRAFGNLTRGERNSLDDIVSTSSSFQTFCPVVAAGKATSGDPGQGGDQRETKFSSLPNMDQMSEAQRQRGGAQKGVSQAASSSSLPCISSTEDGLTGAGRRCLPQLSIPEKIVEEKRNLLSKKLERKLQSAGKKKKKRKRRTDTNHQPHSGASDNPNGRIDGKEKKTQVSGDESDDCMSVTSWEVADILASADPMAPQDSEYEDSPASTDDENVTSAFKSCRVMSSASETETLDGSSTESDHRNEFAKEFSPIQCHVPSAQDAQSRLNLRSQRSSNHHVSSVKPVSTSSKTDHSHTTIHNPIPIIKNSSEASSTKVPSLFKLLRHGTFRFRTSVLSRRSSTAKRADRLPFEIFNDVIYLNDVRRLQKETRPMKEKFTVPVIGDSTDSPDWECLEGSVETGDIVVEVNGDLVLNRTSSEVVTTCLRSSDNIQLLVARQRTQK